MCATDAQLDLRVPARSGGLETLMNDREHTLAAPEMSLSEALEYHEKFKAPVLPTKSDRARQALVAEVRRLLFEAASDRELAQRQATAWANAYRDMAADAERFAAALPDIIGCPYGDPAPCRHDDIGFYPCCRSRRAAVRHGLLPAFERVLEAEDGA